VRSKTSVENFFSSVAELRTWPQKQSTAWRTCFNWPCNYSE